MPDIRIQKYKNPIISGYNPDPSICRVGDDFYLVNSTFEFYPGVPVYHSKNLVNWELINYCLRDKEQLYLDGVRPSGGIYAPMLCYHNGEFFMTTTNVSHKGHLIVHTSDIYGKWSKPVWIDQGGIDPTLLFDGEDVYFASTSRDKDDRDGIFMCKINPYTGEKLSESVCISHGCGGICPEGPHIYKLNENIICFLQRVAQNMDIWLPCKEQILHLDRMRRVPIIRFSVTGIIRMALFPALDMLIWK